MVDPAPKADQPKADPALAQYVVNLTPEQYEEHLRQAAAKEAPRPQIEMGGSGTAKATFKDAADGDVVVTSTEWSATGPVTVTPDETDPTSAKLVPSGVGPVTVTAVGHTATGSAEAHAELMVVEKVGAPIAGTIEITVEAPAVEPPPVEPPPPAEAPAHQPAQPPV